MQLKKVYANKDSFKTVTFNPTGLNFIVAKQQDRSSLKKGKTYNGVGKSLLITIIHFCLGANKEQNFCDKLHDWEFFLEFEIGKDKYTSHRIVSEPNKIFLNGLEYNQVRFREKMQSLCFSIPEAIQYLSFRSLLSFFIRPDKSSYVSYDKAIKKAKDYQILLCNSFLLGLDEGLVQKKQEIKENKDKLKQQAKSFQDDPVLKDFLTKNKDIDLSIIELEERIKNLKQNLSNYKVAEDYYELQKKADSLENERFNLSNEILLIQNNIDQIETSLIHSPDINKTQIEKIYTEANILFSEKVKKQLSSIENFYEKLIKNRKKRLTAQRDNLNEEKKRKSVGEANLSKEINELMQYLGEHGALDTFVSLTEQNTKYKMERDKLVEYQRLEKQYGNKKDALERDFFELKEKVKTYLREIEEHIALLRNSFRSFAKKFYPDHTTGLTINNNDGDNKTCFRIEAKIEADASDGINNVKIFCYDLVLLFNTFDRHKVNFIFHDSRLFDGTDERQKTEFFRVVYDKFHQSDKQYIATVNQNQLSEVKSYLTEEEYKNIIDKNIILELKDNSQEDKLLGINVEL